MSGETAKPNLLNISNVNNSFESQFTQLSLFISNFSVTRFSYFTLAILFFLSEKKQLRQITIVFLSGSKILGGNNNMNSAHTSQLFSLRLIWLFIFCFFIILDGFDHIFYTFFCWRLIDLSMPRFFLLIITFYLFLFFSFLLFA